MMMIKPRWHLTLALALAGCTVGPNYHRPDVATPAGFTAAPAPTSPVPDRWWETFGDPALTALVARAIAQNLDIAAANARIAEARASVEAVRATGGPSVEARASAQQQRLSENGAQLKNLPPNVDPDLEFPVYRASLDASWELDVWGGQRRQNEAADARAASAVEDRRDATVRVASEVARNYAEMRSAQARRVVAEATAASSRQTLALVQRRVRAGEEAQMETNRAASELREAEAAIPSLEADARAALFALDLLIGSGPGAAQQVIAANALPSARLISPPVAVGLPSDLLRRRPDIRRAERQLAAETAEVGVAIADLYPRFSLTGSLGLESVKAGDLLESASRFWQVGPSLLAPLLDNGLRRAEVRRQRAQVDRALSDYKQAVLRALSDVETALIRLARERERATRLAASRGELGRNLDLTRLRYRAGEADLLELLDVERRVARLDDLVAQSDARVLTNRITLEKALGGGWETTQVQQAAAR